MELRIVAELIGILLETHGADRHPGSNIKIHNAPEYGEIAIWQHVPYSNLGTPYKV